jgi:hypothetical protein
MTFRAPPMHSLFVSSSRRARISPGHDADIVQRTISAPYAEPCSFRTGKTLVGLDPEDDTVRLPSNSGLLSATRRLPMTGESSWATSAAKPGISAGLFRDRRERPRREKSPHAAESRHVVTWIVRIRRQASAYYENSNTACAFSTPNPSRLLTKAGH